MCGINGIYGLNQKLADRIVSEMNKKLIHRGPDANDTYSDHKISLGHTRLSIIDTTDRANQPFIDSETGIVIVFNGEIFNYQDLRSQLDYQWESNSDTEVILAYYKKYGTECLNYLNGMFAFSIWDKEKQVLFIARDRLGIKPLYYQFFGQNQLIFSSELRPILHSDLVSKKINEVVFSDFLRNLSVRCPNTFFDIKQLEPGHYLLLKNDEFVKEKYWSIENKFNSSIGKYNKEKIEKNVKALVEDSIKRRMVSDVPVAAFLSGGIDSSIIVGVMSQFSKERIHTFSIGFENGKYDESEYARMISNKFNTIHHETILKPQYVLEVLPEYLNKMDSPTVDGINTYIISKIVAEQGIKVVLSGLGGDELFVGYPGFLRWQKIKHLTPKLKNKILLFGLKHTTKWLSKGRSSKKIVNLLHLDKPYLFSRFYSSLRSSYLDSEIDKIINLNSKNEYNLWTDLDSSVIKTLPSYSQFTIAELTNYTLDVLIKDTDQMSMANALEIREPFFDFELIEYVLNVPDHFKHDKKIPKSLLINSFKGLLPNEVCNRPKMGFTFPWDSWFKNELKDFCNNSIVSISKRPQFKKTEILNLWTDYLSNKNDIKWGHVWSLVVLDNWLKINIDGVSNAEN